MSTPSHPELAPGACVRLASGGPKMTVLDVGRHTGLVWCRWERWHLTETNDVIFDGAEDGCFPAGALAVEPRPLPG